MYWGLILGVVVGNILIYKFKRKESWKDSLIAGFISLIVMCAINLIINGIEMICINILK